MEGLASSFMFTLGGLGFIVLDQTHASGIPKLNRTMLQVNIRRKMDLIPVTIFGFFLRHVSKLTFS